MSETRSTTVVGVLAFRPGDGAHYSIGCDAYPYTISRVSASGKTVWARRDMFRANGNNEAYSECPKQGVFVVQEDAKEEKFTLRDTGSFKPSGSKCGFFGPGRCYKQDPSF